MTIDQTRRRELCERLLADDPHAQVELASLYHEAGMPTFANIILSVTRSQAKKHAAVVLSGGPVVREPEEILKAARQTFTHGRKRFPKGW